MRVAYSPGEVRMLGLLREDRGLNSATLARLYYEAEPGETPFNGQRVAVGLLSTLARKVMLNQEPFRVRKSSRRGPHPIFFWREPQGSPRRGLAAPGTGDLKTLARGRKERTGGRLTGSP